MSIVMDIKDPVPPAAVAPAAIAPAAIAPSADAQRAARHRQRRKNWALALLLVALAVLFYFITIVRFGHHG
ncbi:MAG: hypothetical protein IT562_20140 [Alphaproteobacteria bacterium]|nr:hypothetical protein [Alphaproteobacteria bacterium]